MDGDFLAQTSLGRWVDRRRRSLRNAIATLTGTGGGSAVESAYARWAPIYDWVFTIPLVPGQKAAAALANEIGGSLVEVGVGTGLSLPLYGRGLRVTGIDLSEPMLRRARERVEKKTLGNVDGLHAMDATDMSFEDASFDIATVMYVVSVVPDPGRRHGRSGTGREAGRDGHHRQPLRLGRRHSGCCRAHARPLCRKARLGSAVSPRDDP